MSKSEADIDSPGYLPLPARQGLILPGTVGAPDVLRSELWLRLRPAANNDTNTSCCDTDAQRADLVMINDTMALGDNPTSSATQQLTTFDAQASCTTLVRAGGLPDPSSHTDIGKVEEVKLYLSRPQLFSASDYSIDSSLIMEQKNIDVKFWRTHTHYSKVLGAYGIRATTCFKIVVASTPYHAGILRMCFNPLGQRESNQANPVLTQFSQLPGVEINIANTNSAEFKIPYIFEDNFLDINNTNGPIVGEFFLVRSVPLLAAPGADSVPYTIYWWLEDVELLGAIPAVIGADYLAAQQDILNHLPVDQTGLSIISKEQEVKPARFSAIAASGAYALNMIGKYIPSLSSLTGPPEWFLRQTAKVAASYGWSKPVQTPAVTRMLLTSQTYRHNVDGFDTAYNLGATVDTCCAVTEFAGTSADEMSIGYLTSISTRYKTFSVSKQDTRDTLLFTQKIQPGYFYDRDVITVGNTHHAMTPLCMLSTIFAYWRGTYKFKFKIAKTQFHTGRLLIGFIPQNEGSTVVPLTSAAMDYVSQIVDLRHDDMVEFTVPFICPLSYLKSNQSSGTLFIRVLDPLRCPEMVSSNVVVAVEVSGGDDLEFAVPCVPSRMVVTTSTVPTTAAPLPVDQVGDIFGSAKPDQCQQCIGNRILSLKQLMSRQALVTSLSSSDNSRTFSYPYTVRTQAYSVMSTHAMISSCYALFRGGWKLSVYPRDATRVSVSYDPANLYDTSDSVVVSEKGPVHVTIPYYSQRSRNANSAMIAGHRDQDARVVVDGTADVYASYGEDAQFGYFTYCPFVITNNPQ